VVEKSTVPALTSVQLQKAMAAYSRGGQFRYHLASTRNFFAKARQWEISFIQTFPEIVVLRSESTVPTYMVSPPAAGMRLRVSSLAFWLPD
jgi:hypothetical protein